MEFNYAFKGDSKISQNHNKTDMSFSPDLNRDPTFFVANLKDSIIFREAISSLHQVVVSDMRFKPKDKSDYKEWLKEQESFWLAEAIANKENYQKEYDKLKKELDELRAKEGRLLKPYYEAQNKYFKFLYKNNYDKWFVLDPVITVHPDEVFFECFSQDESSYGKLSCSYNSFKNISKHSFGTTNIDYSEKLYNEFQKIREYKETTFTIDPTGFEVSTELSDELKEEKIDLPDSWIRGFLQISSAMTLNKISFDLLPIDIYNILLMLKRNKEKNSPRSLRFILTPNKPIEILFEPWNKKLLLPRSLYFGKNQTEIRMWGRRRLFILERLLPIAKSFKVSLLGTGMPSFWEADLGDMTFTLGLSGWSSNDWSSSANFDLMSPRGEVDTKTKELIFKTLKENYFSTSKNISEKLNLDKSIIESSLSTYAQKGLVLYDMKKECYRIRELSNISLENLKFSNEREEKASNLIKNTKIKEIKIENNLTIIEAKVKEKKKEFKTKLTIDNSLKLKDAICECWFYKNNQLRKGPCEHILSTRAKWSRNGD